MWFMNIHTSLTNGVEHAWWSGRMASREQMCTESVQSTNDVWHTPRSIWFLMPASLLRPLLGSITTMA